VIIYQEIIFVNNLKVNKMAGIGYPAQYIATPDNAGLRITQHYRISQFQTAIMLQKMARGVSTPRPLVYDTVQCKTEHGATLLWYHAALLNAFKFIIWRGQPSARAQDKTLQHPTQRNRTTLYNT
jgi:hypothetical protein